MTESSRVATESCRWRRAVPRRVLVAEDDAVYRHLLQTLLQRASFSVTTVANGLAALQAAQAENAPRLLIFDWMMPGMSGPEICRRLRQERTRPTLSVHHSADLERRQDRYRRRPRSRGR